MTKNDFEKFSQELAYFAAGLQVPIDSAMYLFYFECLKEFELSDLKKAMFNVGKNIENTYGKLPSPKMIKDKIVCGDIETKACTEWDKFSKALTAGYFGKYGHEPDQFTLAAIKSLGGLKAMNCMKQEYFLNFIGRQFIAEYKRYASEGIPPGMIDNKKVLPEGATKKLVAEIFNEK